MFWTKDDQNQPDDERTTRTEYALNFNVKGQGQAVRMAVRLDLQYEREPCV